MTDTTATTATATAAAPAAGGETVPVEVLVIGSGPAGATAALYSARAQRKTIMLHGNQPGGQLVITSDVENYPGFEDPITGPELTERMEKQAVRYGATVRYEVVTSVELTAGRPFRVRGHSGTTYEAQTVVVATGAQAKWLGLDGEKRLQGKGVSGCATCDGFMFRGKAVAVVGGGNTAVEEALFLTKFASSVTLIHRRDSLRAEKILQQRFFGNPKIRVIWNAVVTDVLGEDRVSGLRLARAPNTPADAPALASEQLAVDGVFVAIGHEPNTALFRGILDHDADGYLVTRHDSTRTNIEGVFAAGDVKDKEFRQAVTAAGMGCMAALEADRFLSSAAEPKL